MKKAFWILLLGCAGFSVALTSTPVQAAVDYEELTYDDLVSQLSERRENANREKSRSGQVRRHLGLGIVNTWSQVSAEGRTYSPSLNGFEVSSGVDLNSELVRGEFSFRNFFEKNTGSQSATLREIGAGVQFRRPLEKGWNAKFGGGFAVRFLHFADSALSADVDQTSSMLIAGAGVEYRMSPAVAFGGDLSTRLPFGTTTADRNSIDLALKLDTSF